MLTGNHLLLALECIMYKKLPNFFIVGAAKSGTTSLVHYIEQHPDIYMSAVKEPFYYVSDHGYEDFDEYAGLFSGAKNELRVGEASTGYLFDPCAAQKIKDEYRDAKIIICLRNPIDMAFSYWKYMQVNGSEDSP